MAAFIMINSLVWDRKDLQLGVGSVYTWIKFQLMFKTTLFQANCVPDKRITDMLDRMEI